jgi:hypothetical protein
MATANDPAMMSSTIPGRFTMNAADFNELSESEKEHFYKCGQCGEMVDMRQLDDVVFHEPITSRARTFNTAVRFDSKNDRARL